MAATLTSPLPQASETTLPNLPHFIAGQRHPSTSPRTAPIFHPATGQIQSHVPLATAEEINLAVRAAAEAFPAWSAQPPLRRARVLFRFREILERRTNDLAAIINREHGKVLADARGEVQRGLEVVEFATGIPDLLRGDFIEQVGPGIDSHSLRQPLGPVAGITPFNFPVMVPLWMAPIALACGNTFILKPSERDPSAALLLAEMLIEAGLPPGVFNVLHGDKAAVDALLAHPEIAAISFVGSTPIAEHVYAEGTRHGKRVQALGGAKNHMVILPDADLDAAADALTGAAFGSAGERCMAISVAVAVTDATADALIRKLTPRIQALQLGDGLDPTHDLGPLVTQQHLDRVTSYIALGQQEGATLLIDGRQPTQNSPTQNSQLNQTPTGFFLAPTLFDHVTPAMRIYREEIFGPVLAVVRVPTFDAALNLVNTHEFGNGAALFTRSGHAARQFAHLVQAGMVGINVPIPVPMAFHSFGGWKRSLFGDHAIHGMEGVRFNTRLKTITARWPTTPTPGVDTIMPTHG